MDYAIYDVKEVFTLEQAAILWCDAESIEAAGGILKVRGIFDELRRAAEAGTLPVEKRGQHRLRNMDGTREFVISWPACFVKRDALCAWAKSRGVRPKFLFPEVRDAAVRAETSPTTGTHHTEAATKARQEKRKKRVECAAKLYQEKEKQNPTFNSEYIIEQVGAALKVTRRTVDSYLGEARRRKLLD